MARMSRLVKPLFWGSAGAAVAYLWDPDRGRSRRIRLKDQMEARARRARRQAQTKVTYARTTAEGKVEQLRQSDSTPPPDDTTLTDKIRSEVLGNAPFEGHGILVDAADGVVTLRGELSEPALSEKLEAAVRKVPGVAEVRNLLHPPETPAPNKEQALQASARAGENSD